jgi:hypothetical protein
MIGNGFADVLETAYGGRAAGLGRARDSTDVLERIRDELVSGRFARPHLE